MHSLSPKSSSSGFLQGLRQRSRTLYWRISAVFLLLTFSSAAVYALLITNAWSNLNHLHAQRVHWELAADFAEELQPYFETQERFQEVYRGLYRLSKLNPAVDVYLLDKSGNILSALRQAGLKRHLDTAPLEQFINSTEAPSAAILGDHPYRNRSDQVAFSVSPIKLFNGPGYLYVVLEGSRARSGMTMFEDSAAVTGAVLLFLTALTFTAVLGLFIFSRITRRFGEMTTVLRQFEKGDYSRRIPLRGAGQSIQDPIDSSAATLSEHPKEVSDEIDEHAKAFNQMAQTITDNISRLEQTDQTRRELIASVSHDVLQPLQIMQTILETLQMKGAALEGAELQRYIQQTMRSLDRLNKTLEDLFELSKLDAQEREPEYCVFDVSKLAEDQFSQYTEVLAAQELRGNLELAEGMPNAWGDPQLISRALVNLLENAVRYTPSGGSITLGITHSPEKIRLAVSDSGIGIAEDELPKIFERFYRAKDAQSRQIRGTGLGLAIVKRIVEVHGERFFIESTLGKGTTVGFELSCASAKQNAAGNQQI